MVAIKQSGKAITGFSFVIKFVYQVLIFLRLSLKNSFSMVNLKLDYMFCLISNKTCCEWCSVKTINQTVNPDFDATLTIKIKDNNVTIQNYTLSHSFVNYYVFRNILKVIVFLFNFLQLGLFGQNQWLQPSVSQVVQFSCTYSADSTYTYFLDGRRTTGEPYVCVVQRAVYKCVNKVRWNL